MGDTHASGGGAKPNNGMTQEHTMHSGMGASQARRKAAVATGRTTMGNEQRMAPPFQNTQTCVLPMAMCRVSATHEEPMDNPGLLPSPVSQTSHGKQIFNWRHINYYSGGPGMYICTCNCNPVLKHRSAHATVAKNPEWATWRIGAQCGCTVMMKQLGRHPHTNCKNDLDDQI